MAIGDQYDGGIGRAVHLMQFYMSSIAESAGWKWSSDNDAEVQDMVECIISAATPEQPMLYIWKIERTDDWGHDEYSAAIVVASTEGEARRIHPNPDLGGSVSWVAYPDKQLKVTKMGTAAKGLAAGIVLLASYHAG